MSIKSFIGAALLLASTTLLSAQGISFEKGSWADVTKKAKAENKFIFVDAYAEWCGPCKWMAKNVFTDATVADHFNKNFISYKFDMEKGEGPEFAKSYSVNAYPTLLFFDANGNIVHKAVGAKAADELIDKSKDAMNPSEQVFTMKKKFEGGDKNLDFLKKYISSLIDASEDPNDAVKTYLGLIKKDEWTQEENFRLIASTQLDLKSEIFRYVLSNRLAFEKSLGNEIVKQYFTSVYIDAIQKVSDNHDIAEYNELKADIQKNLGNLSAEILALLDFVYNIGDVNEFKYTREYLEKYCKNANLLNKIAWQYFENETDNTKLNAALKWVEKAISLDKNWYSLDTKANLLDKLGKKKEALAAAKEAVKLANAAGEDASDTEALIRKLKK